MTTKVKPILFNTEMVRAVLDNRKTVTRRVVKPKPVCYGSNIAFAPHDGDFFLSAEKNWLSCRVCRNDPEYSREGTYSSHHWIPPYSPGDILYVRETWAKMECSECNEDSDDCESAVERDGLTIFCDGDMYVYKATDLLPGGYKWHPSIHMPREAARIFLRVTDVRVERLQDITCEQVIAEGVACRTISEVRAEVRPALFEFQDIWDSTIKPADRALYGWDANPWVWAIEFERCEKSKEKVEPC